MPRIFEGLIGATLFLAGGILIDGLANLIDEGLDMQASKYEVQPLAPVTAAFVVDHCKHCGFPVFVPADREPLVLGYLCSTECERENTYHYSFEREEDGFF